MSTTKPPQGDSAPVIIDAEREALLAAFSEDQAAESQDQTRLSDEDITVLSSLSVSEIQKSKQDQSARAELIDKLGEALVLKLMKIKAGHVPDGLEQTIKDVVDIIIAYENDKQAELAEQATAQAAAAQEAADQAAREQERARLKAKYGKSTPPLEPTEEMSAEEIEAILESPYMQRIARWVGGDTPDEQTRKRLEGSQEKIRGKLRRILAPFIRQSEVELNRLEEYLEGEITVDRLRELRDKLQNLGNTRSFIAEINHGLKKAGREVDRIHDRLKSPVFFRLRDVFNFTMNFGKTAAFLSTIAFIGVPGVIEAGQLGTAILAGLVGASTWTATEKLARPAFSLLHSAGAYIARAVKSASGDSEKYGHAGIDADLATERRAPATAAVAGTTSLYISYGMLSKTTAGAFFMSNLTPLGLIPLAIVGSFLAIKGIQSTQQHFRSKSINSRQGYLDKYEELTGSPYKPSEPKVA